MCSLILLLALTCQAATVYSGKAISITDGDTFDLRYRDRDRRVRLAEIDAPDRERPYGDRAKQALSDLVLGKRVQVVETGTGSGGRILGRVYVDGMDVNATLVKLGYARVSREFGRDPELMRLEQEAKARKRGLWSLEAARREVPAER